jgi:hypothetical protein
LHPKFDRVSTLARVSALRVLNFGLARRRREFLVQLEDVQLAKELEVQSLPFRVDAPHYLVVLLDDLVLLG